MVDPKAFKELRPHLLILSQVNGLIMFVISKHFSEKLFLTE